MLSLVYKCIVGHYYSLIIQYHSGYSGWIAQFCIFSLNRKVYVCLRWNCTIPYSVPRSAGRGYFENGQVGKVRIQFPLLRVTWRSSPCSSAAIELSTGVGHMPRGLNLAQGLPVADLIIIKKLASAIFWQILLTLVWERICILFNCYKCAKCRKQSRQISQIFFILKTTTTCFLLGIP